MDKTNVMAYFSIYGDHFPINEVTQLLGIEPTKSYNKGEVIVRPKNDNVISHTINYRIETAWELSSGYQESNDVKAQLDQILEPLKNKTALINHLKMKYKLECLISIVIKIENGLTPGLHLDTEQIDFANRINAEFDIDMYANPYSSDFNM
ncbi:DUF4279 domain-containing protein [Paenibacillus sp. CGMCC 1.16610]|uniref:DUF4279 domain-containing protein n=1 Tax=Paenibacillus anseongense TaxID=2682845 RepID=A0ABW9U8C0_9BACL|nr:MULTISPECIES: DUF4279 domain-containing protein [Paenibacillus]MBA2937181.1 DUF4279 domain-containing protein [Paenibacillus sp. CGMCC 1.16610]MVQ36243.1 DUF4279 domain-containing protein [Paenibacillus anseongense]